MAVPGHPRVEPTLQIQPIQKPAHALGMDSKNHSSFLPVFPGQARDVGDPVLRWKEPIDWLDPLTSCPERSVANISETSPNRLIACMVVGQGLSRLVRHGLVKLEVL